MYQIYSKGTINDKRYEFLRLCADLFISSGFFLLFILRFCSLVILVWVFDLFLVGGFVNFFLLVSQGLCFLSTISILLFESIYIGFCLKEREGGKRQASKIHSPSLNEWRELWINSDRLSFFLGLLGHNETFLRHLIPPWISLGLFLMRVFLIKVES